MAALVWPNVVRYSIIGSLNGQDCINVLDIDLENNGSSSTRNEQIPLVAGDLLNQWSDHILPALVNEYTALEVRYVDLNSLAGITGSITSTDGSTWPEAGAVEAAPMPNNVYAKMVKQLDSHTRTARNGALRLSGIPQAAVDPLNPNTMLEEFRDDFNTRFELLKDGINGVDNSWTKNLGVLHTVNKVATGFTFLSAFTCAEFVGTIRRRMPGYGS